MRARLASPRRRPTARGRLVLTAAAAAVALVGGVVVAAPDSPVARDNVQQVALQLPTFQAGAEITFDVKTAAAQAGYAGAVVSAIDGLPAGVTYDAATGIISGTPTTAGTYNVVVHASLGGFSQSLPVTVTVNNADGTAPAGAVQGGAQVSTGSSGLDAVAGAVLGALGMGANAGSSGQAGTTPTSGAPAPGGSLGQLGGASNGGATATATAGATATPATPGPLGSLGDMAAQAGLNLGSLGGGTATTTVPTTPTTPATTAPGAPTTPATPGSTAPATSVTPTTPAPGPFGSLGQLTGNGQVNTDSLAGLGLPLASLGQGGSNGTVTPTAPTTTPTSGTVQAGSAGNLLSGSTSPQGQIVLPGSSTDTGSLANLAPALGSVGLGLVGLAGLSLLLSGGSSMPGSTMGLPVLPGSSTTGSGGSAGAPAAPAPAPKPAPGPTVANGRG